MNNQITDFVHDALKRGVSREDINRGLLEGGWSQKEINTALDAFVKTDLPIPVPRKRVSGSAKEAFLFLMLFSALYAFVFALGSIVFDLVNIFMPDPGEETFRWVGSLRIGMATVVVAFPIFLFMSRIIRREAEQNPGQRISPVRRWLTYLTLFVTSASLVVDLILLVVRFLSGDLTLRFGSKVFAVAVMAGIVLIHYLRDLRRDEQAPSAERSPAGSKKLKVAALTATVVIILGLGIYAAGPPPKARLYAQDNDRVQDLENISRKVQLYYTNQGVLPDSLAACDSNPDTRIDHKKDRITGKPYQYRVVDTTHFMVGAQFAASSPADNTNNAGASTGYWTQNPGFWRHGSGMKTFTIDATKKNLR